jgi:putative multiple sugar transport system permease protein
MGRLKSIIQGNIRQYGMLVALIAIMLFFQVITDGILLKPLNITNLILQNSYILIMAIGMLLVIVAGHIDLSVGSIVAFIGATAAVMTVNYEINFMVTILACLALGFAIGAWQGFWIAYVKIPAFIVTLAGMLVFRGLTLVMLQGASVGPFPTGFQKISSGFIPDVFGSSGLHMTTLVLGALFSASLLFLDYRKRTKRLEHGFEVGSLSMFLAKNILITAAVMYFCYLLSSYKGLPNVLVILFVLTLAYTFMTTQTVVGRQIYALGGNEKAAKLSGVKTDRTVMLTFANLGLLSALAGLVFAARLNVATPKAGTGFELDVIAACFIGGASATGGIGTVIGAIVGALVMGVMNNGMSIMGVGIDWQQAIKGMVLLFAVFFDVYNKSKN